jgi:hypothetical protein
MGSSSASIGAGYQGKVGMSSKKYIHQRFFYVLFLEMIPTTFPKVKVGKFKKDIAFVFSFLYNFVIIPVISISLSVAEINNLAIRIAYRRFLSVVPIS